MSAMYNNSIIRRNNMSMWSYVTVQSPSFPMFLERSFRKVENALQSSAALRDPGISKNLTDL